MLMRMAVRKENKQTKQPPEDNKVKEERGLYSQLVGL